jgi:hypothetical protein
MKRKRHSPEQIIRKLRAEKVSGTFLVDVPRRER